MSRGQPDKPLCPLSPEQVLYSTQTDRAALTVLLAGAELDNMVAGHAGVRAFIGFPASLQDATNQQERLHLRGQLAAGHPGTPAALDPSRDIHSYPHNPHTVPVDMGHQTHSIWVAARAACSREEQGRAGDLFCTLAVFKSVYEFRQSRKVAFVARHSRLTADGPLSYRHYVRCACGLFRIHKLTHIGTGF